MNEEIINKRWENSRKELKKFYLWYTIQNKKTQDKIQDIVNYYNITFNDLIKPISKNDKARLERKIEEWKKLGIYNGYFKYHVEELLKKNNYKALIEILIYGVYQEEEKEVLDNVDVIYSNVSLNYYNLGRKDLGYKETSKVPKLLLETMYTTLVDGIAFIDYINALYLTNMQEINKEYLINLQQNKKLDIYSDLMERKLEKQRNRLVSINDDKYSGGLDKYITALGNDAYLAASGTGNVKVKFISDHCEHTTKMCEYMDGMIFNTKDRNVFKRPYGNTQNDLQIMEIDIMGLVLGINKPPITNHFHWCHSVLTYITDKSSDELRSIIHSDNLEHPNFIGYKKKDIFTEEEILKLINQIKYLADKYYDKPSKWSGNIQINNELPNGKLWNCDMTVRNNASAHELLHEILHSKSISYYDVTIYRKFRKIEEASVQLFNQEICIKEDIEIIKSGYDEWTNILRKINKECRINETDYLFAKALFSQPLPNRLNWLKEKAKNNEKMLDLIKELE